MTGNELFGVIMERMGRAVVVTQDYRARLWAPFVSIQNLFVPYRLCCLGSHEGSETRRAHGHGLPIIRWDTGVIWPVSETV